MAMGGSSVKWDVTYTKHVKQKRKVYQDGFLELDASSQKVILYDNCDTILYSRSVKKDDLIKSGETLTFESYLVDIGDLHGDHKPLPKLHNKITMASKSFQSPKFSTPTASFDRKPNLGMAKSRERNLSPSQKIIRAFKKNEMEKYDSLPGHSDTIKSSKKEWQVLYTTQITQKAKKYHDGILQLLICGSQKQVLLYDVNRRLLDSRFIRKDEVIISGESINFDGHLVDIGECEGDNKPQIDLNLEERNCNLDGKVKAQCGSIYSEEKLPIEWEAMYTTQVTQKSKKYNDGIVKLAMLGFFQMQVILLTQDGMVLSRRRLQSSETENIRTGSTLKLENYLVELGDIRTNGTGHQNKTSSMTHSNSRTQNSIEMKNVSAPVVDETPMRAALEILSVLKRPTTHVMDDTGCTNRNAGAPDTPTVEPKILAAKLLDLKAQETIAPVPQDSSVNTLERGYHIEPVSCEENPTGGVSITSSIKIPSVEEATSENQNQPCPSVEGFDVGWDEEYHATGMEKAGDCISRDSCYGGLNLKTVDQDNNRRETDDFPSFDLGF